MPETTTYTYLAPRQGSHYEQYFFTGRNLRAETLYRATVRLFSTSKTPVTSPLHDSLRRALDPPRALPRQGSCRSDRARSS